MPFRNRTGKRIRNNHSYHSTGFFHRIVFVFGGGIERKEKVTSLVVLINKLERERWEKIVKDYWPCRALFFTHLWRILQSQSTIVRETSTLPSFISPSHSSSICEFPSVHFHLSPEICRLMNVSLLNERKPLLFVRLGCRCVPASHFLLTVLRSSRWRTLIQSTYVETASKNIPSPSPSPQTESPAAVTPEPWILDHTPHMPTAMMKRIISRSDDHHCVYLPFRSLTSFYCCLSVWALHSVIVTILINSFCNSFV